MKFQRFNILIICIIFFGLYTIQVKANTISTSDEIEVLQTQIKNKGNTGIRYVLSVGEYNTSNIDKYGIIFAYGKTTEEIYVDSIINGKDVYLCEVDAVDESGCYYVTLYDIPIDQYETSISVRAYVKEKDGSIIYSKSNMSRSLDEVALNAYRENDRSTFVCGVYKKIKEKSLVDMIIEGDKLIKYNGIREVVVIPSKITSIEKDAFYGCTTLTNIDIPISVKNIGESAFEDCINLMSITITNKVKNIERYAFSNCTSLINIEIPNSVKNIGDSAFYNCTSLKSITLPFVGQNADGSGATYFGYIFGASKPSENSRFVPSSLKEVIITGSTSIEDSAFYNCTSLESITLPFVGQNADGSGATYFGYIFGASKPSENSRFVPSSLKEVIITGSTSIESLAFSDCTSLTTVKILEGIKKIGDSAFYNCTSLESITLPFVGQNADGSGSTYFGYIFGAIPSSLKEVIITGGKSIESLAFSNCTSLTTVKILEGIKKIGDSAFGGCSSLTSVELPSSVVNIGETTFTKCTSLKNVYYRGSIKDWCNIIFTSSESNPMYYATDFYMLKNNGEYEKVTEIQIPETIKKIGDYQFFGFDNIESLILSRRIRSIGNYSFSNCTSLTSIEIPSGVISIGTSAFENCIILKIYCEIESQPSNWDSDWNYTNCPVVWGYKNQ